MHKSIEIRSVPAAVAAIVSVWVLFHSHTPAIAQTAESQPDDAIEEIIVTSQRRAQRLQDVPAALTAIGGDALVERGVVDLSDLAAGVPGLAITGFAGVNASNLVSIRGVSGQLAPIGASQATAIYLDGVYLSRPDAAFFGLNDVERIEVLRGPQGTLYGRNATAGAINIITRMPGNEFAGGFNVSYGNYNEILAKGDVSGPLASGLSGSVSLLHRDREGLFTNTTTGSRIGDKSSTTGRGTLRYENGEKFEAILSGDWTEISGPDIFKNGYTNGVYTGLGDPDVVGNNEENRIFGRTNTGGGSLTMNYELNPNLLLTSISAWRTLSRKDGYDIDGSDLLPLYVDSAHGNDTLNQEIRAVYSGERLNFTIGANYFNEDADFGFIVNPPDPSNPRANLSPYDTSDLDAIAAFAQVEFDLSDLVSLRGGLRYNYETRDFTVDYSNAPVPGNFVEGTVSDNVVLPMVGVVVKPAPDLLFYAQYSQGYQAPGFGFVPGPTAPANTFGPETLHAYEVGFKSQFLDRRVTLNAAAFYLDYKDLQVRTQIQEGQVGISNAASASSEGLELELLVYATQRLRLRAHGTYLRSVYDEFCEAVSVASPLLDDPTCVPPGGTAPTGAQRAGNRLNNAPDWSGGIGVDYSTPVSDTATLNFNANYTAEATSYFHATNGFGRNFAWRRLNVRAGLQFNPQVEVFAYGRNLTDDRYCALCVNQSNMVLSQAISAPRMYGVGVDFRFQ